MCWPIVVFARAGGPCSVVSGTIMLKECCHSLYFDCPDDDGEMQCGHPVHIVGIAT